MIGRWQPAVVSSIVLIPSQGLHNSVLGNSITVPRMFKQIQSGCTESFLSIKLKCLVWFPLLVQLGEAQGQYL